MIIDTIKKREDFIKLSKSNIKYFSKNVIIAAKKTEDKYIKDNNDFCRIGYVVTRKVGNAVIRNRIKRRFRNIIKNNYQDLMKNGYDYVVIAKFNITKAKFIAIEKDIIFCLKNIIK